MPAMLLGMVSSFVLAAAGDEGVCGSPLVLLETMDVDVVCEPGPASLRVSPGAFWRMQLASGAPVTCVHPGEEVADVEIGRLVGAAREETDVAPLLCRRDAAGPARLEDLEEAADDEEARGTPRHADPAGAALFVLGVRAGPGDGVVAQVLDRLLAAELGEAQGVDVLSLEEADDMLRAEGQRTVSDCSEESSCLADLAGALGARYLVSGAVDRLESVLSLTLTLTDTERADVLAREVARGKDLLELSDRLTYAVKNLLVPIVGGERRPVPGPTLARRMGDPDVLLSGGAAAASAGAATGCLGLSVTGLAALMVYGLGYLGTVFTLGPAAVPCLLASCCVGAGVFGVAELADALSGVDLGHVRAVVVGAVSAVVAAGMVIASAALLPFALYAVVVLVAVAAIGPGVDIDRISEDVNRPIVVASTVVGAALGAALASASAFALYIGSVGIAPDERVVEGAGDEVPLEAATWRGAQRY